ncbi:MAG: hypothetical protein WD969_16345 [Paracoccaceae bacterium]
MQEPALTFEEIGSSDDVHVDGKIIAAESCHTTEANSDAIPYG